MSFIFKDCPFYICWCTAPHSYIGQAVPPTTLDSQSHAPTGGFFQRVSVATRNRVTVCCPPTSTCTGPQIPVPPTAEDVGTLTTVRTTVRNDGYDDVDLPSGKFQLRPLK